MKISRNLSIAVMALVLISVTNGLEALDKEGQRIIESISREVSMKPKRPFCNAFTGCGKKRSYSDNSLERQEDDLPKIRIPISVYKALLRAATQEIRNAIEHEVNMSEQNLDVVDQDYPPFSSLKMPIRKRYQS